MARKKQIVIDTWNGGLSDGSRLGSEGSFRFGQGLDYKTSVDSITANLALELDDSPSYLTKWIVYDPVQGDVYTYNAGGLIRAKSSGTWSQVRNVSATSGQGLEIYDDYLYYARNSTIGRYGALSGSPSATDGWQTGLNGTTSWRPLKTFQNLLCVGNGRYLATWDGSTWTAQALTFPPGWFVRAITVRGDYLAIAVNNAEDITEATRGVIFYWDGTSSTYNFFNEVPDGGGISAIVGNQDSVWVFAGHQSNIYLDTGRINIVKRIPFMGRGKTVYVNPGAAENFNGNLVFGLTDGTSSTVYRGVYELGQHDKNYPTSLNFGYPFSTGTTTGTTLDCGAIAAVGDQIYVGFDDNGTEGIDLLSTSNQQTSVIYQSRVISLEREASFQKVKLLFEPLASGQSITLEYRSDRDSSWTSYGTAISFANDSSITAKTLADAEFRGTDAEFRLTLAGTATSMPTVHKMIIEYDEEGRL